MKTVMAVTAAVVLTLTAPAFGAGYAREVSEEYRAGSGAIVGHGEVHWTLGSKYVTFRAQDAERFVSLAAEDSTGQPVLAHVHIDRDGDGKLDRQVDFCAATEKPIAVQKGTVIEVGAIYGMCGESSPSVVTEGTITATFTR